MFKYKRQIKKRIFKNHYDFAFIGILPFSFLSLASYIKKINPKIKVIVDMKEPLTANASYFKDTIIHKKFILSFEKKHAKNIDFLIVLNQEIKDYYRNKYLFLKNIIVLEQGTEPFLNPTIKIKNDKIELIYAGMFYKKLREPFILYEAIDQYVGNIRLSVFGTFKKRFLPPLNERFYYGGMVDRCYLNDRVANADIIVFLDNFFGLQIPGKVLESLASNKPILFIYKNEFSPTFKYVKEYEGVFYTRNDAFEIIKQIENIIKYNFHEYNRDISKYYWKNLVKNKFMFNTKN